MLKDGIFSHLELEKNWTDEYGQSFPVLGSADQSIANKIASLLYSNQVKCRVGKILCKKLFSVKSVKIIYTIFVFRYY